MHCIAVMKKLHRNDTFQVFVCSAQLMIDSCSSESEFQHLGAVQSRHHRSLVNSFPFNQASLEQREQPSRQVKQSSDDVSVDFDSVARSERCIDKVEMEERTEYDEVDISHRVSTIDGVFV